MRRRKLAMVVRLGFPSIDAVLDSETVELSRTGVFLLTADLCPVGTAVRLTIAVDGRNLVVDGVVARTTRPPLAASGLGIEFDRPVVDDTGLLDELLAAKWLRATSTLEHARRTR